MNFIAKYIYIYIYIYTHTHTHHVPEMLFCVSLLVQTWEGAITSDKYEYKAYKKHALVATFFVRTVYCINTNTREGLER
jgi:hypothetical protein